MTNNTIRKNRTEISFQASQAFTLIELLVVMGIIAVLSGMSLFALQGSRESSRDAKRKADLEAIRSALELYRADNGVYPGEAFCDSSMGSCPTACNTGQSNPCGGTDWDGASGIVTALEPNYIRDLPVDLINDTAHYYYYEPVCNQTGTSCGTSLNCPGADNCCVYELGAYLEGEGVWYKVCSP